MKQLIILLLLIPSTFAFYAGEKLNLTYPNITDADFPCYYYNGSVYVSGAAGIGDKECTIYYMDWVTESTTSSSSSGSSGSSTYGWYKPKPKNATKNVTIANSKSNQQEPKIPTETPKETPTEPTSTVPTPETPVNNTTPEQPKTGSNNAFWWIIGIMGAIIVIVIAVIAFMFFKGNDMDGGF